MMKRETKRRIAYYQEALPDMKKKVSAAALMLMIAVIVSVTATYAWMTLSVAPVVSSVNTTMSANGTLEIALSNPEGTEPEEMDIDESVSVSSDVKVTNLQWGNLINLSDSSYGIDNLVLRPAQLNTASLKNSPLWGAVYGSDGRITTLDSNYTFMKWKEVAGQEKGDFMYSQENGVRAIASYTVTVSEGTNAEYAIMSDAVVRAQNAVENAYADVAPKMADLSTMISSFAQGVVNEKLGSGSVDPFSSKDIQDVYNLYVAMLNAMELEKDAMVALANFQSFIAAQDPSSNHTHVTLTWDDLVANKANYNAANTGVTSKNGIISITGLTQFITDLNTITTDTSYLERYYQNATTVENNTDTTKCVYYWDTTTGLDSGYQISDIVQRLISWTTMTMVIDGVETRLTSLSMDTAISLATSLNKKHTNVYVCGGVMKNFEQIAIDRNRLQGQTNGSVVTVTVKAMGMTINVYGDCYTKAADSSYFMTDYMAALGEKLLGSDVVGEDTYGMAVDFWLRTNAEETYLTLEGAIAAEEDGTVYSYDGINRVWGATGDELLTTNSTTQGGGSCYIYYADTPEDMMRSLQLLKSMKVAFVDPNGNNGNGALLAQASMDTENYYAVNGRITVPLAVEATSGVSYTYTDTDGTTEMTGRAVTLLTHDAPVMITAIIYLDGAYLSNDDVLAANHIDGQLNIQFGSSVDLETLGDNKLLVAERVVTAEVSSTELNWATALTDNDLKTDVTVTIEGTDANNVTAFFIRAINSTQGERQLPGMTFTKSAEDSNKWTASYKFNAPGIYYLRHVRLDGVDYALENPPKVVVEGFDITSVTWDQGGTTATVYSPENSFETTVVAKIRSDNNNKEINSVQARFLRDDGAMVNAELRYDPTADEWEGTGIFYRSGTYKLEFLLVNGEYYDISSRGYELELYLGISVAVYNNGSSENDVYKQGNTYTKKMGVTITDNDGNALPVYQYKDDGSVVTDSSGEAVLLDWATTAKLAYAPGGTMSSATQVDLVWDDAHGWFTAEYPISKPGRYSFVYVNLNGNLLTRATASPIYTVMSPDPPTYDTTSESQELQFAPMTNDGYIGPIKVNHAEAAALVVEVYNSASDRTYLIPNEEALKSKDLDEEFVISPDNGTMVYSDTLQAWLITPTYTANSAVTQEGTWTIKNIYVWNYMNEDGSLREFEDRVVWSGTDGYDFSKLTTTISCTVNVAMTSGTTTTLGSSTTDFMSDHYVKDIGMSVTLKDDGGRTIPAEKIKSVILKVSYTDNSGDNYKAAYGYEVKGYTRSFDVPFTYDEAASDGTGAWVVSGAYKATENWTAASGQYTENWQYVGEYTVSKLTVTTTGGSKTVNAGENGVPEMYTVTSAAPDADNLSIDDLSQNTFEFGKTNGTVTGTFLESYDPSVVVKTKLTYDNGTKEAKYARISGTEVYLHLDYQDGTAAPNGGYTWSGDSSYDNITMKMTETSAGTAEYESSTSPLLSGTYKLSVTLKIGDDEGNPITQITKTDGTTEKFNDIEVYSMKPSLTVSEHTQRTGYVLTDCELMVGSTHQYGFNQKRDSSWFDASKAAIPETLKYDTLSNGYDKTENMCTVYIPLVEVSQSEESGGKTYTGYALVHNDTAANAANSSSNPCPSVQLQLLNLNTTFGNITVTTTGSKGTSLTWTFDAQNAYKSNTNRIGSVSGMHQETIKGDKWYQKCTSDPIYHTTRSVFGSATVSTINVPYDGCTFTVTLDKPFTLNNPY